MSFIFKLGFMILLLFIIVFVDYRNYNYYKKFEDLKAISSKTYVNPSFIFKSKEYKEFVYVK